ncbi:MAG: BadF/BadG/BcrA/BcrD ATPase family protein [Devosia sp.]|nr:BadF/BadG/BcrA/BcrD ATPase family protein [Devosia sp.]
MSDLVLGIDGGGTKTLVALADRFGRVVHTARAGGSNPLDNPAWRDELQSALAAVAGVSHITAAVAALPSYGEVEAISLAQSEAIAPALGSRPQSILNDVDAAQIGAFAGQPGILILSGTGSMAWARDAQGRSHRVGGWGDVAGDEGSGFWIGHQILGVVTQSLDGRAPPTMLVEALFAEIGADIANPSDGIEGWVSGLAHPRSAIAALAPLAIRLAETGDSGAVSIVEAAADELARHVRAIERHAGRDAPWSYAGGTFKSHFLLTAVAERIGRPPVSPRLPPIGGALLAAARLADWSTENAWIDRLRASLQELPADQTTLELTTT